LIVNQNLIKMRIILKYYILFISFLFVAHNQHLFSQNWIWSRQLASNKNVLPTGLTLDNSRNVYIAGQFQDSIDIGAPSKLLSNGKVDAYLAKYDSDNNYQWHVQIGDVGRDRPKNIFIDKSGDLVLCGFYDDNFSINGENLTTHTTGKFDSYIAKFDTDGNLIWAKKVAWGPQNIKAQYVTIDAMNNIYVTSNSTDTIYFEGDTLTTSNGKTQIFVAKFDSNGNLLWTKQILSSSSVPDDNVIIEIYAATLNEIYLGGFFTDTLTIEGTDVISQSGTEEDIIIIKINSSGNLQWLRQAGSVGSADRCNGISTDIYGNVYITGYITSLANFDSTSLASFDASPLISNGNYDMMIAKYNKNGILQWKTNNGNSGADIGYGAYVSENIVLFTGYYSGEVIFNNDTLKSSSTTDNNTGFFVYDVNGNPVNGKDVKGLGEDRSELISIDDRGNTYISGQFQSDTLFIGSDLLINTTIGSKEGFVAKYHNPFSITFTESKNISCNGGNDGRLIVTPYFGIGPYNYQWSANVTSSNDSLAFNLSAGNYSVTVTDSRDSTAFTSIILSQPSAITIDSLLTHVTCYNWNNGAIDITVNGGTVAGDYQYIWTTDVGSGLNPTAEDQTGLTYGNYFLTVTDDNSCEASDTFTITQPDHITFGQSVVTNVTIPPGSNGAIDLTVSGGTPGYLYSWTGPGTFSSTDEDISNLDGGTYIIQVTDFNTCTNDTSFLVADTSILIAYISSKTNVDCKGNSTGSATVAVTGGSGDYTYAWRDILSNPVGGNDPVLPGVPANTYFVLVTDNTDARTAETSVIINEPAFNLTSSISGSDLKCYNDGSGVANLSVSGGTLPYYYNWSNGATTEDLINLQTGNYSVTITDANGCIDNNTVFIDEPEAMAVDIVIEEEILCHGDLTGRLRADVTGGTGMISYLWNDPASQNTKTATDLEAGNYTVTITDQNKCKVTNSVQLTEPLAITITESIQDPSCFGLSDGQIIPTVSGGTAPFDYVWSTGWTNRIITNIQAGNYTLTVTDRNNCTEIGNYSLTDPLQITFDNISITDASCFGYDDGSISITASGGTGTYEYSNDNGVTYQTSPDFITLIAGDYTLIVKDENNCESTDSLVSINQPDGIDITSEEVQNINCRGDNNGTITIVASGGAGNLRYSINDGAEYSDNSGLFTGLMEGEYPVRVIDDDNCEVSGSVLTITAPDSLIIISEETQNITCNGNNDGTITIVASGGTGTLLYSINNGTDYYDNSGIFDDLSAGNYNIKVRDANLCETTGSALTVVEPDALIIDTTSVIHVSEEQNGTIILGFTGGTEPLTYILIPETTDSLTNNTGQFDDLAAGNYIIYALDNNGCLSNSISVQIIGMGEGVFIIYDAFSPNADGKNDVWNIGNIQSYPNCVVKVFNSWGTAVFNSKGYDEPWDGKHNGNDLPAGTYYYYIDLGNGNGTFTGTVNIVK
jgi:gliding motility-associated-like protein